MVGAPVPASTRDSCNGSPISIASTRPSPRCTKLDFEPQGFEWIDCCDADESTLSFIRKSRSGRSTVLVVCNFTPVPRENYLLGVPRAGYWRELLNSDAPVYGGSGIGQLRRRRIASRARARALSCDPYYATAARRGVLQA